ncbi:P-loop NTPase fold protein [Nocardioides sp.]|uniref:P-loop NTPase fold protein n=1 Tax=Nocardioides sp. TaxID=35761 RepID=UPI00351981B5
MLGKSPSGQAMEVVRTGDLIPDNRLAPDAQDLLEHDAIARGLAEIAWSAQAPVNIALFGAWGSGKSSVYWMIEKHLDRIAPKRVRIARYDAWKYGGRELKRNFIDSLAHELGLENKPEFSDGLENDQVDTKLNTLGWVGKNWLSLLVGVALAAAVAVLWVLVQATATWVFTDSGFKATSKLLIAQAGTVFGLALVASLVGPKVFEGAVITNTTVAPEGSDQFAKRFTDLVNAALTGKNERLVVFIDELDRCDPKDVVATLIDLKTFLDQDRCAFVVAADREVIERALREVPQAKPVREDEPYYATPGAFLDKIFQHQLALPPLRSRALTKFAHDLVDDQGGVWEELRNHGKDTFDRTVFALIPVHVRSPRRVKVLLNNFATSARIAQSRGIDWLDRAHEVAVLTVLQTEFPAVADDLRRVPRLLVYLRGEERAVGEAQTIADQYRQQSTARRPVPPAEGADTSADAGTGTAAGRLLSDDTSAGGARDLDVANATLRRHLADYLAKVAAAGIRDPRPDLLYLQVAGGRETLADPKLGDVIDFAADTAPDTVVQAFAAESSQTLAVAIPLLVIEGDNDTGPGRAFAYESACRLLEQLDSGDQDVVAHQVAPSLIAAATAGSLSDTSLPGALLVACWSGAHDAANQVLERLAASDPVGPTGDTKEELLVGLTTVLPFLDHDGRRRLVALLADRFAALPKPLLTALGAVPAEQASELWGQVGEQVLAVLNKLELPEAIAPAPAASTAAARAAAAAAAAEPTGMGLSLLADIVDVIRGRGDHESLLSAVIATAQSAAAADPIREWVVENVDSLVGTMSSPTLQAKHALVGMNRYRGLHRDTWAGLLPDPADAADTAEAGGGDPVEAETTHLANQLLTDLLYAFVGADDTALRTLPALTVKVAGWGAATDEDVAAAVRDALVDLGWAGGGTEDTAGQLLWDRKEQLLATATTLSSDDTSPVFVPFVDDLAKMLTEVGLTAFSTSGWRNLAEQLPKGAAEDLSAKTDAYEATSGEAPAALRLRLTVRAVFGGAAPAASEIADLDQGELTTALIDAWLALEPVPNDALAILPTAPFTPNALRNYCNTLETDPRTAIWLALRTRGAADGSLRAAGASGIGAAAVEAVRTDVTTATREPDRTALTRQLMMAKPAADVDGDVKKAASELAMDLVGKNTARDFRTAAEVVLWAGGAGHGHTQALRQKFNGAPENHRKALPQAVQEALVSKNLLNPAPKKKRRTLFGGGGSE